MKEEVRSQKTEVRRVSSVFCLLTSVFLGCRSGHTAADSSPPPILLESWRSYVARFIQQDGRVIDYKAGRVSTSEGQAYAMLRAVWVDDRATFDKVHRWAVDNLNTRVRRDHLWAWKWGHGPDGTWRVLDSAFATDADQDAALALLLGWRRWGEPRYREQARAVLADLWERATVRAAGRRYLLAGDSLCKGEICRVNPSYYAPYAYRIFRDEDPRRSWHEMVGASYWFLDAASRLTKTGLPPDWVELDRTTGEIRPGTAQDSAFSYDAFRVYWRVALDYELSREPQAAAYLKRSLRWVETEWGRTHRLPAVISSAGRAGAAYESLEMIAGLMAALRVQSPRVAEAFHQKLAASWSQGAWADRNSYYLQNWAWFGTAVYEHYLAPFRL